MNTFSHKPEAKQKKEEKTVPFLDSRDYSTRVGKLTLEENIGEYCKLGRNSTLEH